MDGVINHVIALELFSVLMMMAYYVSAFLGHPGDGRLILQKWKELKNLAHPSIISSMAHAVSDVAQTRSILQTLGPRPDHEVVDSARAKISEIESRLSKQLDEIVLAPCPETVNRLHWRSHLAEREKQCREEAERERSAYKALLQLDEMHDSYEKLLREAEERLVKIYSSVEDGAFEK